MYKQKIKCEKYNTDVYVDVDPPGGFATKQLLENDILPWRVLFGKECSDCGDWRQECGVSDKAVALVKCELSKGILL